MRMQKIEIFLFFLEPLQRAESGLQRELMRCDVVHAGTARNDF